jgi:hypothetical protein
MLVHRNGSTIDERRHHIRPMRARAIAAPAKP